MNVLEAFSANCIYFENELPQSRLIHTEVTYDTDNGGKKDQISLEKKNLNCHFQLQAPAMIESASLYRTLMVCKMNWNQLWRSEKNNISLSLGLSVSRVQLFIQGVLIPRPVLEWIFSLRVALCRCRCVFWMALR